MGKKKSKKEIGREGGGREENAPTPRIPLPRVTAMSI